MDGPVFSANLKIIDYQKKGTGGKNMKGIYVLATTVFLSVFLIVTANADMAGNKNTTKTKKTTTQVGNADVAAPPQGLTNLKKVMNHKIERSKKMHKKIEGSSGN